MSTFSITTSRIISIRHSQSSSLVHFLVPIQSGLPDPKKQFDPIRPGSKSF